MFGDWRRWMDGGQSGEEGYLRLRWSHRRWQEQRRWKGHLLPPEVEAGQHSSVSSSNGVLVP